MPLERWNNAWSDTVDLTLFGRQLQLKQDPNSYDHGTTIWDASLVFAKCVERQKQAEFTRARVGGRRVLELGAGVGGVAGTALALLGAAVTMTDLGAIVPLLRRNAEHNLSPAALKVSASSMALESAEAGEVGSVEVAALDWDDPEGWAAFSPPYDFVLAADCVYSETAVPRLLEAVLRMAGPRTCVAITNEFRSQSVQELFMQLFGQHFSIKTVPPKAMDPDFCHPAIKIYVMKLKKRLGGRRGEEAASGKAAAAASEAEQAAAGEHNAAADEAGAAPSAEADGQAAPAAGVEPEGAEAVPALQGGGAAPQQQPVGHDESSGVRHQLHKELGLE